MQLAVDRPHRRGDTREDGILLFCHTNISARNLNEYLRGLPIIVIITMN